MENGKWKTENYSKFLNFPLTIFHFPFFDFFCHKNFPCGVFLMTAIKKHIFFQGDAIMSKISKTLFHSLLAFIVIVIGNYVIVAQNTLTGECTADVRIGKT